MNIRDEALFESEKIIFALRELYLENGYTPYRMSKFEEYDLYAKNKDFLVSDNVITFNDRNGRLLALKPDVTLSIIKNSADDPSSVKKVFYNENVYRPDKDSGSFSEIRQTGVECFGNVKNEEIREVLRLSYESLQFFTDSFVIALSDISILYEVIGRLSVSPGSGQALLEAVGTKNLKSIREICEEAESPETAELLTRLLSLRGNLSEEIAELKELFSGMDLPSFAGFLQVMEPILGTKEEEKFTLDFSVTSDFHYYNGIVFKGFLSGIPQPVLSGGQYDNLMKRLHRRSKAIGFAVYTDLLGSSGEPMEKASDGFINVALPKGRLGEKVYLLFEKAGYECPKLLDPGRQLIFENTEKKIRYFWVKPSDVAIYVERGAADIGVAGKDIILEYEPDVYELLDLCMGKCRMAVAAPNGFADDPGKTLRVATKFSNIASAYYRSKGRDIELIHLNGSIEIAPILGLSDVIVDIVETGSTLRENNLSVIETVVPISARLIANKSSEKFKREAIERIENGLRKAVEENQ